MNIVHIGIDTGASGGMAVFYPNGVQEAYSYKKEMSYCDILNKVERLAWENNWHVSATVERLTGFQGGGRQAMMGAQGFKMGLAYGRVIGWLEALQIPFSEVLPRSWQAGLPNVAKTKAYIEKKRLLKMIAQQRYPNLKPTLQTCDAILIAEYATKTQTK